MYAAFIHAISLRDIASDKLDAAFYATFITECIRVSIVHKRLGNLLKI